MMARGLFVTGTDTGIGKTVLAAALLHRCRRFGPVRYWKPIQTGLDDDTQDVIRLAEADADEIVADGIRLPHPVSPHLAATKTGTRIDLAPLVNRVATSDTWARWIVEGAGGVLVPLNEQRTIADLIVELGFPAVIATSTRLGTINHTLLTVEALRTRSIPIIGVVMIGRPDRDAALAIERHAGVHILGEMPRLEPLTSGALARWAHEGLDTTGSLRMAL